MQPVLEPEQAAVSFWAIKSIADLLEVVGFVGSIIGFISAVVASVKARKAAERAQTAAELAQAAAQAARLKLLVFDAVSTMASVIAVMEDLSGMHRNGSWAAALPKYSSARRALIEVKSSDYPLEVPQQAVLQSAIAQLVVLQRKVERLLGDGKPIPAASMNNILSNEMDNLTALLTELKNRGGQ